MLCFRRSTFTEIIFHHVWGTLKHVNTNFEISPPVNIRRYNKDTARNGNTFQPFSNTSISLWPLLITLLNVSAKRNGQITTCRLFTKQTFYLNSSHRPRSRSKRKKKKEICLLKYDSIFLSRLKKHEKIRT